VQTLILSAGGINLNELTNALRQAQVDQGWVITNNAGETVIGDSSPDFITAVFSPSIAPAGPSAGGVPFTNVDVAIRAGRAVGRGQPVLLVAPPPLRAPADMPGVVVAPCPLDEQDTLYLHIWAFVSTLPARAHLPSQPSVSPPADFDATSILEQLYSIGTTHNAAGSQLERLVASLLSQAGAELVENQESERSASRVDLAFLPSRTDADVVIVEIKAGHLSERPLAEAEQQLQRHVLERHASLGLLLYHDFDGKNLPNEHVTPLIARMSVRELIAGLQTNSLPQLLKGVVKDSIRRM
jgi:hypothetical protein